MSFNQKNSASSAKRADRTGRGNEGRPHPKKAGSNNKKTYGGKSRSYTEKPGPGFKGEKRSFSGNEGRGDQNRKGGRKPAFGARRFEQEENNGFRYANANRFDAGRMQRDARFGNDRPKRPNTRSFGERKSFDGGGDRRSFDGNRKPFNTAERKPYRGERRSFDNNRKPYRGERRSFDNNRKPYRGERKPFECPNKPLEAFDPVDLTHKQDAVDTELILSGRNPIREALKAQRDIEKLMVMEGDLSGSARQIVSMAREAGVKVQVVDKRHLDGYAKNHQGLVAIASAYQYATLDEVLAVPAKKKEQPFFILLDKITDPHNLGAIIRTAVCCGVHGVIIPRHRAVGLTSTVVKASSGAIEYIKVARVTNLSQTVLALKKQGIWVYAADMDGTDIRKADFSGAVALVIGSEGEGVSSNTKNQCDGVVAIPMAGAIDSLNASVAAGIIMHSVYADRHPVQ